MSVRPVRVSIVSFNLANTTETLSADSTEVLQFNPDIHVEATQEDYRPIDNHSIFGGVLTDKRYSMFDMISLNTKPTDMNVVLRVYMKYGTLDSQGMTDHKMGKQPLPELNGQTGKFVLQAQAAADRLPFGNKGFSKGAVWIKIYEPYPMLFINMHLPILKTKGNKGLGFEFRAQKLKEILRNPEITALATPNTTVFVMGDLNFRINPDQHDQLTNLIASDIPFLKELDFLRPEDRVITCKFEKNRGEACAEARRIQPVVPGGPPMATGMDYCVSEKRTPSRCDRILVHSAVNISIKVLQHKGADLVDASDHNALFATVELGYLPSKAAEPAWGSGDQNTSNNEAIARIAQSNENARAARKMEERKRGLGGWLFGKRRQTRKQKQNRRRTRKA